MTAASVAASGPRAPSLFIMSPAKDALFFFGSVSAVLVAWVSAAVFHVNSFYILGAVALVSNGPHLISTWTRVYFDSREWKARPLKLIGMPLLIGGAVAAISLSLGYTGTRLLNSAPLYWATWHFVAQNWGILRIYQMRSGEPLASPALRVERWMLFLFVLWCLLYRMYTGPHTLFGTEVFHVVLPLPLIHGLWGAILFLVAVFLQHRWKTRREPYAKAALLRAGFLACAFIGFFVPFQLITTDDTSAFAAAACWHGFQYLGIVRHYHRSTWKDGVVPQARVISWLSQPGMARGGLYFAFLLALAGVVYGFIFLGSLVTQGTRWDFNSLAGVVWVSLTLSHYYLDGVIWKLRKPELARRVGAVPVPA